MITKCGVDTAETEPFEIWISLLVRVVRPKLSNLLQVHLVEELHAVHHRSDLVLKEPLDGLPAAGQHQHALAEEPRLLDAGVELLQRDVQRVSRRLERGLLFL